MTTVLVTGASGFVGCHLLPLLIARGYQVLATSRNQVPPEARQQELHDSRELSWRVISPDATDTEWRALISEADVVVHLAARVHIMHNTAESSRPAYLAANTEFTKKIAEIALRAGTKRFIFASTIKVLGEKTVEAPFSPHTDADPQDPYAESKYLAEIALRKVCDDGDMEYVIVRPALVIGAGADGNLERLVKWIKSGVPIPFGGIKNRRSLISVETLCEILTRSVDSPRVANSTLLAANPHAVSTPDIVRALAIGFGKPARLLSIPPILLDFLRRLPVAGESVSRLSESLEVDASEAYAKLDWQPDVSILDSLRAIGERNRHRVR